MLNIEQIIKTAEENGAVVYRDHPEKGIGFIDENGEFQEITSEEIITE